ncbi:MAG: hypothetical protein NC541_04840 [bacterium]|nr:hypothetical protein [bacterium]
MLEALKKKSFKHSLICSIILLVIGLSITVVHGTNAISSLTGYQDFKALVPDEIRDQLVEIDVDANYGSYMEEYTENTSTHRRTTTDLYYIIMTGDEYAIDYRYMTIKVPVKYQDKMDAIMEDTYNGYYSDSPLHFAGKIRRLDSEEYGYFEDFFTSAEWTADEISQMTLPYYIDVTGTTPGTGSEGVSLFMLGIGIILIGIGVYRVVKGSTGGYMKKFRKAIEDAGYSEASIESDMGSATAYEKKSTVKIGRLCTYYSLNATVPRAIPNSKIVWAYQNTTTHRTNGIKTGVTYSVMIYADGEKNAHTIPVSTEAIAQDILKKMIDTMPWVIVGYSDDLKKLFNKDRAQFLQLKYNTVEHVAVEPGFGNPTPADSTDNT